MKRTSEALERKNVKYAENFKKRREYPAVVIGAEFSRFKQLAKSGPIQPTILVSSLRKRLALLGTLYSTANGNIVGCCAEVHAANSILARRPSISPSELRFSKAIRPRTMQEIPRCQNCRTTFR